MFHSAPFDRPRPGAGDEPSSSVEVELAVGDSVRIGDVYCTVVEIVDGEVHLRVDPADGAADPHADRFAAVAR